MNAKLLLKIFLTITLFLMVTGCGDGATPADEVASESDAPAVAVGFTPSSKCIVPDVVGLDQAAAEGSLITIGLQPVKSNEYNDLVAAGAVISQEPAAGTTLEPCQGDVVIVISLGAVPVPTETPGPTETPAPPTETPIPTPVPPTATPTPDPRLFFDDFETGIRPEWDISGENFVSVNGQLTSEGVMAAFVGDGSWTNYSIEFQGFWFVGDLEIIVRQQDKDNYMTFKCGKQMHTFAGCGWWRVVDGEQQQIPGATRNAGLWDVLVIEAEGDVYRTVKNGETEIRFVDNTFTNGGMALRSIKGGASIKLDGIEVQGLP